MDQVRPYGRMAAAAIDALQAAAGPWLALACRLWLAQAFLLMAVHDMMFGPSAGLSAPFGSAWWGGALHGIMASTIGLAVGTVCPVLLALGLLSRPVALAMLVQTLVMPQGGAQLLWAALLVRIVVVGPGPLALDGLLGRGAESIALPGAAQIGRALARLRRWGAPGFQTALRAWLALALLDTGAPGLPQMPPMIAGLPVAGAVLAACLLLTGTATRIVAALLLVLVPLGQVAGAGDARLPWALLLALLVVHGAGLWAVDGWLRGWLRQMAGPVDRTGLPHVVVLGGGFGGVAAVRGLRGAACRVTLIDQRNHHLFQPLLYQVATASLAPGDIATPIRAMLRGQDVRVLLGEVTGVDPAAKAVHLGTGRIAYDYLVVATGARHSYFGRDDWSSVAPGLKTIEDSTAIRRRLLLAFEEAEGAATEEERRAWLTFVIVGGGPTGVELAGAIAELAQHGLEGEFREIDPASATVLLVQAGPRLLPAFPEALSVVAANALRRLGVEVWLDRKVEEVEAGGVTVSGQHVAARTVLWAAGVMASPAASWLGVVPDRAGRVPVGADLGVAGLEGVYAVGDTAASEGWAGQPVPGLAPAAKQGGTYVARVIRARLLSRPAPAPFRYRHLGSLATIGRQSAVADFGVVRVQGALAWWLWGAAHIAFLADGRKRITVLVEWLWAYLTFRRGTRLITGG